MKNLVASLFLVITIISCSKEALAPVDEGKDPINEISDSDLGHDRWGKVSIVFTEGKIIENKFRGYKNDESLIFKTEQKYEFKSEGQEVVPIGRVVKLVTGKTYGLEIKYYNTKNVLMNKQFTTAEMGPIHQHFFITDPREGTLRQKEKNTIDYIYRDTRPIDKMIGEQGVSLRAENDPIGLKGYFRVFKKPTHTFDLNVVLVHILGASKLQRNGSPYPFYAPSLQMIGVQDLNQKVPMKIIADKDSSTYLEDVATEYGMTKTQVSEELKKRKLGNLKL